MFAIAASEPARTDSKGANNAGAHSRTHSEVRLFSSSVAVVVGMMFSSSLNWLVRSQAHFELAKIEEDIEQLDSARDNLIKVNDTLDSSISTHSTLLFRLGSLTMPVSTRLESTWH